MNRRSMDVTELHANSWLHVVIIIITFITFTVLLPFSLWIKYILISVGVVFSCLWWNRMCYCVTADISFYKTRKMRLLFTVVHHNQSKCFSV